MEPSLRRAVSVSLLISLAVGTAIGTAAVFEWPMPPDIGSGNVVFGVVQLVGAIGLAGLVSAQISIPLGVLGGVVANWALRKKRTDSGSEAWVGKGAFTGALIGGIGAAAYSATFNGLDVATGLFGLLGAGGGTICGTTMGFWCARQMATLRG